MVGSKNYVGLIFELIWLDFCQFLWRIASYVTENLQLGVAKSGKKTSNQTKSNRNEKNW